MHAFLNKRCDGSNDCGDNSDEANCDVTTTVVIDTTSSAVTTTDDVTKNETTTTELLAYCKYNEFVYVAGRTFFSNLNCTAVKWL